MSHILEFTFRIPTGWRQKIKAYFKNEPTVVFVCSTHFSKPHYRMDSVHPRFPQSWSIESRCFSNKSQVYCNEADKQLFGILTRKICSHKLQLQTPPFQQLELIFKWSTFDKLRVRRKDTDEMVLELKHTSWFKCAGAITVDMEKLLPETHTVDEDVKNKLIGLLMFVTLVLLQEYRNRNRE